MSQQREIANGLGDGVLGCSWGQTLPVGVGGEKGQATASREGPMREAQEVGSKGQEGEGSLEK